ncbi:MFS transporter [uncultured Microbacterium sp.]|uniref:MFS transporter n=1 Tax=uncultured Microbacterium sp. TaxID=191216 RepID=UPI0032B30187
MGDRDDPSRPGHRDVYPTLLAVVGDVAHPTWRARAVGVYRVWRDLGYAVGAIIGGIVADLLGLQAALWVAAAISAVVAAIVAGRMYETLSTQHRNGASAT